jgi:septal ring factor EnvC (AmiA/AmiB activator)
MSAASNWLANLPDYSCPTCAARTIFKHGCTDCDRLESDREEIKELEASIAEDNKIIDEIQVELPAKRQRLMMLKRSVKQTEEKKNIG